MGRLTVEDERKVRAALERLGRDGEASLARIQAAIEAAYQARSKISPRRREGTKNK